MRLDVGMWSALVVDRKCLSAGVTNVQIVPDPFWTLVGGARWGDGLGVLSQSFGGSIASGGPFRLNHADTNICSTLKK